MTDSSENLVLEHLKRFQAGQERTLRGLKEIKARLSTLEGGQGSIVQHLGHLASSIAGQKLALDHMSDRIDRIEHRLELA